MAKKDDQQARRDAANKAWEKAKEDIARHDAEFERKQQQGGQR